MKACSHASALPVFAISLMGNWVEAMSWCFARARGQKFQENYCCGELF